MSKAYIAWAVKLAGYDQELHVTLKYLGEVRPPEWELPEERYIGYLIDDITVRLESKVTSLDLAHAIWTPVRFNPVTHVLVLDGLDRALLDTYNAVASLRLDDYPVWRPHITVPKALWLDIRRTGAGLADLSMTVGPLTLYVNKKPVHTF